MGTSGKRTSIPSGIADWVLFSSDRKCCVCRKPEKRVQAHHIDGDRTHHTVENIAALCMECHDDASRTGGLTRKLSPGLVKRYREEWYQIVAATKAQLLTTPIDLHHTVLNAVAAIEVRKIRHRLVEVGRQWDKVEPELRPLFAFTRQVSTAVVSEIFDAVSVLNPRQGMPPEVASLVATIVMEAAPTYALRSRGGKAVPKEVITVLDYAGELGFEIAYDGAKYLRDLQVVDAGAQILWFIMRHATLCKHKLMQKKMRDYFASASEAAAQSRGGQFDDAIRWLKFRQEDALAAAPKPPPDLPEDLWAKVATPRAYAARYLSADAPPAVKG